MIESHLDVGGVVVFWSLAEWSDRKRLQAHFAPLGIETLVPDPRPASACLRAALDEVLGGPRVLVRPLASRDGFACGWPGGFGKRRSLGWASASWSQASPTRPAMGSPPPFRALAQRSPPWSFRVACGCVGRFVACRWRRV